MRLHTHTHTHTHRTHSPTLTPLSQPKSERSDPAPSAAPAKDDAGAASPRGAALDPTPEQAADFNWWNAKAYGDLRKECERRGLRVQGGKEQLVRSLMAAYA